jgi:hypothetical protein
MKTFGIWAVTFFLGTIWLSVDAFGNEAPTSISLSSNTVSEDSPNNDIIGILSGTDPDDDPLTFTLLDDAGGRFKVNGTELQLANYTLIDYDSNPFHTIIIQASDGSLVYSDSFLISVTVSPFLEIHSVAAAEIAGRPAITTDGHNFFVVWRDTTTGSSEFLGARITPDGVNLDPGGISLGSSSSSDYGFYPAVSFDGVNYLVVWVDTNLEIYAVRVTSGGIVLDSPAMKMTTGANSKYRPVSIAFGNSNYLIAWRDQSDTIKVSRVSTTGVIIDHEAGISIGSGFYPRIAFDGTNYLVVWHAWGNGGTLDIIGNRVSSTSGTALDGTGFVICEASDDQDNAFAAFDGKNYLVVWHDYRDGDIGYNDGSVYGARVSTNGLVLDDPAILISELSRGSVTAAFNGRNYFVTWQLDYWHVEETRLVDVFGQKVSKAGILVDEVIPICTAHGHQWGPQVHYNNEDKYIIAWTENGPHRRENGVWGTIIEDNPLPRFPVPVLLLILQ